MSYLGVPRLHFAGRFRANPSTINNAPGNYDHTSNSSRVRECAPDEAARGADEAPGAASSTACASTGSAKGGTSGAGDGAGCASG